MGTGEEVVPVFRIPLTAFVTRELWVRSPEGFWQFFRILGDRIIEIREDGTIFEGIDYPVGDAGILGKPPLTEKSTGRILAPRKEGTVGEPADGGTSTKSSEVGEGK